MNDWFDALVASVADAFAMRPDQVLSADRHANNVEARWVVALMCRKQHNMSLPAIGRRLGRDHTTVLHGLRQVEARPDLLALTALLDQGGVA